MSYLPAEEASQLKEALSHLHVEELELQLTQLGLSSQGFNKNELIERLMHYAITGKELPPAVIPAVSRATKKNPRVLDPQARMLYGAYKNDLATRNFFKKFIGNHFHFTAQGIDWLRERWLQGNPPTYGEFAHEWQDEYERTRQKKRAPKQEWAYIRFVQDYMQQFPTAPKNKINEAWKAKRLEYVQEVKATFHLIHKNLKKL